MEKCNKCKKEISEEEFNEGMGECLSCFPIFGPIIENPLTVFLEGVNKYIEGAQNNNPKQRF